WRRGARQGGGAGRFPLETRSALVEDRGATRSCGCPPSPTRLPRRSRAQNARTTVFSSPLLWHQVWRRTTPVGVFLPDRPSSRTCAARRDGRERAEGATPTVLAIETATGGRGWRRRSTAAR